MIDLPPPSYEQTIQAIESCGVARSKIGIKYENYLQSEEVTISDIGEVTDNKLRCIRRAVHPLYILTLANLEQQGAFDELARRDDRPAERQRATEWIGSKGWTARVPAYDENVGLEVFARALERACKLKTGSVAIVPESRFLSIQPVSFTKANFEEFGQTVECLMHMIAASNAEEHGVRFGFGFIGNEAIVEEKK